MSKTHSSSSREFSDLQPDMDNMTSLPAIKQAMSEQLKVRDRKSTMQTMRAIAAAYFPRNVVDNMVKYDASHYNDDLGRVSYVSDIIANMIAYQSGHCADPTCQHGDTTNKAPH